MIESFGDGPNLALIHGWGIGPPAWDGQLPLLTPHFRVHRVTLPGYGPAPDGEATPASTADNAPDFAQTAAALIAALPAGCTLCGWSLGALLAVQAALLVPQRAARLILCAATPAFMQRDDWPNAQPTALLDGFATALASNAATTVQRFAALLNQGDRQARANTRTLTKALAAKTCNPPDGATLARGLDWLRNVDLRASISAAALPLPTLLMHGADDRLVPLAAARWLNRALPRSRLEVFDGAAHAPFINDPPRFAQLIVDFCHAPAID